ncbi:DUF839 domain-containing protein [Frankia sp. CNm7]|uniref:DUF839 domain-containing protein n=1 Tax=Frankia nepalensis TaxID=1836974 RepID=A0A937UKH8_9ACTN|nr:alkaline phosphatase PhoX [Frankia nepalensis]MBL7495561.1 DUF839 domain-containing protein [Frankia nepalensis]MBL7509842.1 DUF839 domain-containing protein [Frankia nepalensis]MBL7517493.1 DUF839 domain-containing protein [Frankia nepalensis]MBL7626834.1 DUF839 domain-containing protein [Frankia nepalensis]
MTVSRRGVLGASAAGLGIVLTGSVGSVFGGTANATGFGQGHGSKFTGYGDLIPDPAGIADLPRGFRYKVLSTKGEKLSDGGTVPAGHDGMAAFDAGHNTALVRNHELTHDASFPVPHNAKITYDPGADGGTTTLVVRGDKLISHVPSLSGTVRNCAGGFTPWGTWLTCEETELTPAQDAALTKRHGYVFEVDPFNRLRDNEPVPLKALGRFAHEATAIDPRTGVVYLTEDAGSPDGLFYRFLPNRPKGGPGSLRAGGKLQALYAGGLANLGPVTEIGTKLKATWVDVPDPDATTTSVRKQFAAGAVSGIPKCEGTYYSDGYIYVVSSYAGGRDANGNHSLHEGQVWRYEPKRDTFELVLRFAPDSEFDGPDNIALSSWGRIVLCEDGDDENYLVVVGDDNKPYKLARSVSTSEWAGATFSPNGKWLYANIQGDGRTLAITGPWR